MKISNADALAIREIARREAIDPAALFAIIAVESGGKSGELTESANGVYLAPTIRFEGHYFYRLLSGDKQKEAIRLGLANPRAGAVKNPKTQKARWELYSKAAWIDRDAAIMSCSWGVGQVMGAHWKRLGFVSAKEFKDTATSGLVGQVDIMVRFIKSFGLMDEIKAHDWAAFARGYNGPAYKKNGYDRNIAAAYAKYSDVPGEVTPVRKSMLRMGAKGARVRELQALLVRAGYSLKVDGDFGLSTRNALRSFQKKRGLTVDGVAGPEVMEALAAYRSSPQEAPGAQKADEIKEVRDGGITALGGGTGAAVAADKLNEVADNIGPTGITYVDYAVTGLYVVAGALVVGGIIYAAYHYMQSKKTVTD